ncbi:MAG: adenylyltransferase/cytidyltransferase family protein [Candidatus Nanohaloarchaea archaeon]
MKTVLAQGVFDLLHPGHLHYFRESKKKGGELVVVIARDSRIEKDLHFSEDERLEMVEALEVVDKALLGSEGSIYDTVEKIDPDVITLGYDQPFEEEKVEEMAENATGSKVDVVRIGERPDYSSTDIRENTG